MKAPVLSLFLIEKTTTLHYCGFSLTNHVHVIVIYCIFKKEKKMVKMEGYFEYSICMQHCMECMISLKVKKETIVRTLSSNGNASWHF